MAVKASYRMCPEHGDYSSTVRCCKACGREGDLVEVEVGEFTREDVERLRALQYDPWEADLATRIEATLLPEGK